MYVCRSLARLTMHSARCSSYTRTKRKKKERNKPVPGASRSEARGTPHTHSISPWRWSPPNLLGIKKAFTLFSILFHPCGCTWGRRVEVSTWWRHHDGHGGSTGGGRSTHTHTRHAIIKNKRKGKEGRNAPTITSRCFLGTADLC